MGLGGGGGWGGVGREVQKGVVTLWVGGEGGGWL